MSLNDGIDNNVGSVGNSAAARRNASPSLLVATMRMMSTSTNLPSINGSSINNSNNNRIVTPTRTIRLTEVELQQQQQQLSLLVAGATTVTSRTTTTPTDRTYRLSLDALASRPRSNPHSRTPRRYESPLNHDEFHRVRTDNADNTNNYNSTNAVQWNTTVIGGGGNNNTVTSTINEISRGVQQQSPGRSNKQDLPSQRKVRRWNNDSFINLADEMKSSNSKVATVYRLAAKDAHLYRSIYDPNEHKPSSDVSTFLYGSNMKQVRDDFFEGIGGVGFGNHTQSSIVQQQQSTVTVCTENDCWNRIDQRLRKIVERACSNSGSISAKTTYYFEQFIINAYTVIVASNKSKVKHEKLQTKKYIPLKDDWWNDILLECPTITERTDGKVSVQFFFPNDDSHNTATSTGTGSTTGSSGFHRLLLHAVTQFHGLHATSRTIKYTPTETDGNDTSIEGGLGSMETSYDIRTLIVTGEPFATDKYPFRLLHLYLENDINTPRLNSSLPLMISERNEKESLKSIKQTHTGTSIIPNDNDWVYVNV